VLSSKPEGSLKIYTARSGGGFFVSKNIIVMMPVLAII
jgi:hypothetical protein